MDIDVHLLNSNYGPVKQLMIIVIIMCVNIYNHYIKILNINILI